MYNYIVQETGVNQYRYIGSFSTIAEAVYNWLIVEDGNGFVVVLDCDVISLLNPGDTLEPPTAEAPLTSSEERAGPFQPFNPALKIT